MFQQDKKASLRAICYSDIFNYPLTPLEVKKFAIYKEEEVEKASFFSEIEIVKILPKFSKSVFYTNGYFYLKNRGKNIKLRKNKEKNSRKKINLAKKISKILFIIPTIELIGISGSLAMENANLQEDIDLFFIVKDKSIWVTRFFVTLFLFVLGVKRKRGSVNVKNKICANMFISTNYLNTHGKKKNIFIAHEIVQMQPLFEREKIYKKFITSNFWIKYLLPFAIEDCIKKSDIIPNSNLNLFSGFLTNLLILFNPLLKLIQLSYMKKHKTKEIVSDNIIAFHPNDKTKKVLFAFNKKLKKYDL